MYCQLCLYKDPTILFKLEKHSESADLHQAAHSHNIVFCRSGSKMKQQKQGDMKTNRGWKTPHHRERHSPAPGWGVEALPPEALSAPESLVPLATPSSGLLRAAHTSGCLHQLFALKNKSRERGQGLANYICLRHIYLCTFFSGGRLTDGCEARLL